LGSQTSSAQRWSVKGTSLAGYRLDRLKTDGFGIVLDGRIGARADATVQDTDFGSSSFSGEVSSEWPGSGVLQGIEQMAASTRPFSSPNRYPEKPLLGPHRAFSRPPGVVHEPNCEKKCNIPKRALRLAFRRHFTIVVTRSYKRRPERQTQSAGHKEWRKRILSSHPPPKKPSWPAALRCGRRTWQR